MILLLALVIALALALAQGADLGKFESSGLRGGGVVLASLAIQLSIIYFQLPPAIEPLRGGLLIFSYLLLAPFVWWNRYRKGMWLLGIGLAANLAVIAANGGHMPVTYEALVAAGRENLVTSTADGTPVMFSKDILLSHEQTRLWFLSDIIVIPRPFPIPAVCSIGDVIIALGLLFLVPSVFGAGAETPSVREPNGIQ
jgi:hypothetical protein